MAERTKESSYGLGERTKREKVQAPDLPYRPQKTKNYNPPIGLIGCGGISQQHLTAYKKAGYQVSALCDPIIEKAAKARDMYYPKADIFSDYQDVLKRNDIQVVDIATHPELRYPIMEKAVNTEKHILSQKPFVLELEKGKKLVDMAEKRGVKIAVNQNGRWAPHFSYMRKGIEAGLIGDVGAVHMSVSLNHNWVAGTHFEDMQDLILFDFGIHWFDMLNVFMRGKNIKEVYSLTEKFPDQKVRPPMLAEVLISFDEGVGSITFDADTIYGEEDRSVVIGREGTFCSTGPDLNEQKVILYRSQGVSTPELKGTWFPDGFHGAMAELLCAVEEDREPDNSGRDNLHSLSLCFAALESASSGKPVEPGAIKSVIKRIRK